jgi:hypothetical protein
MFLAALALGMIGQKPSKAPTQYQFAPGFFVTLPAAPNKLPAEGTKVWQVKVPGQGVYIIGAFSVKEKGKQPPTDQLLAAMAAGTVSSSGGRVVEQRDLVLQGWPGLEIKIRSAEGGFTSWTRNYVVKEMGFQVCAVSVRPDGQMPGMKAVFDSVRLPGGVGPVKVAGPEFLPFTFPDTGVSVMLPGTPKTSLEPMPGNPYGLSLHVATTDYGNRTYFFAYEDVPDAAKEEVTPERLPQTLDGMNQEMIAGVKGKLVKRSTYTLHGISIKSAEFTAPEDGYGRVASFYSEGRIYILLVTVPGALKGAPELATFFGSIKPPAAKGADGG